MADISAQSQTEFLGPDGVKTTSSAVRVVVSGLGDPLLYGNNRENYTANVGDVVLIPLGTRQTRGWVVEKLDMKTAQLEVGQREPIAQTLQTAFSLEEQKGARLKSVIAGFPVFHPSQIEIFEWIADYYGTPLADVIDTAVPIPSNFLNQRFLGKEPRRRKGKAAAAPWEFPEIPRASLSCHQTTAVDAITSSLHRKEFAPHLLFGITGSGKTEVYLHAIQEALSIGGNAIVIVPEIALTPQLFDQFRSRIGDSLGLLHSQIGSTERWETWEKLLRGELRVALGARSAVFAPLSNIKLIIVDEEHESSYKQADGLRYHARDVAVMRAKLSTCPIVLGSATPSFESLYNVTRKKFQLLEIPERVTQRALPSVELIDLRAIKRKDMAAPSLSPRLSELISETLQSGGQSIIMYNRRGFASALQCTSCGEALACPNCSVSLTFHRTRNRVLCHYCDYNTAAPKYCPKCRDDRMMQFDDNEAAQEHGLLFQLGSGTERVVSDLKALFPQAKILQMDRDTVTKKDAHREILNAMRSGQANILVGTQMIAKGHDLPGVTLVGIVDADVGLHLPDFRSSEKTYQLITQAAGRAGRGTEPGHVVIQTREPDHPAIVASVTGRFKAFARYELEQRNRLTYPPFSRLMRVVISAVDKTKARNVSNGARAFLERRLLQSVPELEQSPPAIQILGPAPAPQERLRGRYRFHLLIKSGSAKILSQTAADLALWKEGLPEKADIRVVSDIDPIDML